MSRQDPGAANGGPTTEPTRCVCTHLIALHVHRTGKPRGACSASICNCKRYEEVP